MNVNIGIEHADRKEIASHLSRLLADTYSLYLTTHNFHWNITGPMFHPLHEVFEEHYTELAGAVDLIAERIRALGFASPAGFAAFAELSGIEQPTGVPGAEEMVRWLVDGQEAVVRTARAALPAAQRAGDESTVDLLVERMSVHEKRAWMLRSILDRDGQTLETANRQLEKA